MLDARCEHTHTQCLVQKLLEHSALGEVTTEPFHSLGSQPRLSGPGVKIGVSVPDCVGVFRD